MIKVLLIEDSPTQAAIIKEMLSSSIEVMELPDFKCDHALSLEDGIKLLNKNDYNIVLSDLTLPDSLGVDTIKNIVRESNGKIPVVALTGALKQKLASEIMESGAQDFLIKEFCDKLGLKRALVHAIERHKFVSKFGSLEGALVHQKESKIDAISAISHDLRTTLNGVMGSISLLLGSELNEKQIQLAKNIRDSGQFMLGTLSKILDFTRLETGKNFVEEVPFSLRACVEEILRIFEVEAHNQNLKLHFKMQKNLPQFLIGDNNRIKQVLANLLSNAIKFSQPGNIYVELEGKAKDEDILSLTFKVRDNGPGVPEDKLEELFEAFVTLGTPSNSKHEGIGLGLRICKNVVQSLGGKISVSNNPQNGATFEFNLDVKRVKDIPETLVESANQFLKGRKVLVVEDDEVHKRLIERFLLKWGMECFSAIDLDSTIEVVKKQNEFDLFILDFNLPGAKADELLKSLGAYIKKTPPVVVLSSNDLSDSKFDFYDYFLLKPVKHENLLEIIMSALPYDPTYKNKYSGELRTEFSKKHPLKILVAEDNVVNQTVILGFLEELGYNAEMVENGKEVLDLIKTTDFDLVLMDIQMPVMDGLKATQEIIWNTDEDKRPYIVAMTANVSNLDREKCLSSGMDDFVSKPIIPDVLLKKLENFSDMVKKKREGNTIKHNDQPHIDESIFNSFKDELKERLLTMYHKQFQETFPKIDNAFKNKDVSQLRETSHYLKGSSLNMGFILIGTICGDIQNKAEANDLEEVQAMLDNLNNSYDILKKELSGFQKAS